MDAMADWFHEAEQRMTEAGTASADPELLRQQLLDQRALNNEIHGQKGRLRDLLATGRKMLKDYNTDGEDVTALQDRMEVSQRDTYKYKKILSSVNF